MTDDISDTSAETRSPRPWLWIAGVSWLAIAAGGLWVLLAYENRPGTAAHAQAGWPRESRLERDPVRPTLVMLAHPQCTCTRASLSELAEVLARSPEHPRTYVVFLKPEGFSEDWVESDLWRAAHALPGVTTVADEDGVEARAFGGATSGQTFLYDAAGSLVFYGGITGARAHPGDNVGRATLLATLNPGRPGTAGTSGTTGKPATTLGEAGQPTNVFGCPLFAERDRN